MDTSNPDPGSPEAAHPTQRPRFPRWSMIEQDLWIDLLESYSCALLDPETTEAIAAERVRIAATLADTAIQEMQYRFWIQRPPRKPRARPRPATRSRKGTR